MTPDEKSLRERLRDELVYYAPRCLKIRTKAGAIEPLRFNASQLYFDARIEEQKTLTGKVRALALKARQQGISTYVEARFFHKVTHQRGARAFILTHLHEATNNLFGMAKRFYEHCPEVVRPSLQASNSKELIFDKLDSGYKVSTAGSEGTGRGDTVQYFHGSESAFWANAETHIAGALQAVPDLPGTEVILESTSNGRQGMFYQMCASAMRGEGDHGQLEFSRGQLEFPTAGKVNAIQVRDGLYGERSAGKATLATDRAEVWVRVGGGEGGHGPEDSAKISAGSAPAERDARKAYMENAA